MISVAIIIKDGEKYLPDCLRSLQPFEEIILLDNGSTDKSLEIASAFPNVKIVQGKFIGFGPLKNLAAEHTGNDWVLSVDCDETLTQELVREILELDLQDDCVYRLLRKSRYNGKLINGCGWSPDWILRLYNKRKTSFNDNLVHESVMVKPGMRVVDLKHIMDHYPYDNAGELLDKVQFYSSLFAKQNRGKIKSSPLKAFTRGTAAFLKCYFLNKGFLNGYEGFLISLCRGLSAYFKYIKLFEENKNPERKH